MMLVASNLRQASPRNALDGCDVEPAAHLVRPRDREVLARGCEQAAALELSLRAFTSTSWALSTN